MPLLDAHRLLADIASGDVERRRAAADAIVEMDSSTKVDVSVFVSSLGSAHDQVVFWSEIALQHLGERGCAAIPGLLALLGREQLFLRQYAVKALAAVGPRDLEARKAIFRLYADSSPFVRREALQASIELPDLSSDELDSIAAMATDPDETVVRWSEIALRNIRLNRQANS